MIVLGPLSCLGAQVQPRDERSTKSNSRTHAQPTTLTDYSGMTGHTDDRQHVYAYVLDY